MESVKYSPRPVTGRFNGSNRSVAAILLAFASFCWGIPASAQTRPNEAMAEDFVTPQTKLRPIGSPSAVDAYRTQSAIIAPASVEPTSVRQAVLMQNSADSVAIPPPSLPQGGFALPPGNGLPVPLSSSPSAGPINMPPPTGFQTLPQAPASQPGFAGQGNGQALSPVPRTGTVIGPAVPAQMGQIAPSNDYAAMPQPQLDNRFATLGNCSNISAPSGYRSDRILTCGQPTGYVTPVALNQNQPIYSAPPAQIGPPVILPPPQTGFPISSSQTIVPGTPGYRPLVSFGQERFPVQVGQGIFGQPTAYVPGQKFRNMIRYITW